MAPGPLRAPETKDAGAFESSRATKGARDAEGARATEGAWSIWFVRDRFIQSAEGP